MSDFDNPVDFGRETPGVSDDHRPGPFVDRRLQLIRIRKFRAGESTRIRSPGSSPGAKT